MSIGYNPKNELTMDQSLKVQELSVSGSDSELYAVTTGTPLIVSDPYLGVAGNYGVLAATAITNSTGTSTITGNLGEYPGTAVSGAFTVSGSTDIANTAANNAQTAAMAAFTAMQTLGLAGTVIASELGGQTLTPGAYKFASGSAGISLTSGHSTLTLNGAGNYIIYTASTLTTGASGSTDLPVIALTGGALAKNVYFVVGSSATINQSVTSAGAVFNGNIIAHDSITVTQTSTINGSLLALTAAVTLSDIAAIAVVSNQSSVATKDITIYIREPVKYVQNACIKLDASNTQYNYNQATIAIVDTKGALSGYNEIGQQVSDRGAIELLNLPESAFNSNDVVTIKYNVQSHL